MARIVHYLNQFFVGMGGEEMQENFAEGVKHTAEAIRNLLRRLEERKADVGGDSTSRVRGAFEGLDLHPRIAAVCALGAVAGLAASAAMGTAIRTILFRVSPTDWFSYAAAALVLFAVALLAAWIPSRRSAAIDPLQSLRAE